MTDREAQVGRRPWAAALLVLLCAGVAGSAVGCDDTTAGQRSPQAKNASPGGDSDAPRGSQSGSSALGDPGSAPESHVGREDGVRTIPTPSGGLVVTPRRPTVLQIESASACAGPFRGPSGQTAYLPPKPGLAAEWQGTRDVLVTITFGSTPRRCRPTQVRVTLDVNDDGQPGISRVHPVRARTQRVRLRRPPYLSAMPDVVAASAIDRRGLTGQTATVLISPPEG